MITYGISEIKPIFACYISETIWQSPHPTMDSTKCLDHKKLSSLKYIPSSLLRFCISEKVWNMRVSFSKTCNSYAQGRTKLNDRIPKLNVKIYSRLSYSHQRRKKLICTNLWKHICENKRKTKMMQWLKQTLDR